jgi:hypothetical protein
MISFFVSDDGTLDTVIVCKCDECKRQWEERFSQDFAADYRDEDTGELDEDDFFEAISGEVYCICES